MEGENKFLIPLAIVVAGVLIGGAVFFKGSSSPVAPTANGTAQKVDVAPLSADDHVLGNPNAKIVLVEFSDFDCPFCQTFDTTMRRLMDTYGKDGSIAWVYRHFPIDQLHPEARAKAEASECVAALGGNDAFWKFAEAIFTRSGETLADLSGMAVEAGVNQAQFDACVAAGTHKQTVVDDVTAAGKAGARGTPYTVIIAQDGTTFPLNGALPYEQVEQIIKTLLVDDGSAE